MGATEIHRPYGLHRRATYDELVQYIKRDNGEFLVHAPDRKSTIIEMMSPYLSAWKISQQAIIAQKQAQLAYWTDGTNGGGQGDAPMPLRAGPGHEDEGFQSLPGTIDGMVDGRENAVAQHREEQRDRLNMYMEKASQNEHDRQRGYDQFFIGSDPDLELADHEGVDLRPLEIPRTGPQASSESLREAAVRGGQQGALAGAAARGAQLAGSFGRGALGSLARDAFAGELGLTTLGGVVGEGVAATGLAGGVLGPGLVPVLGAAAGTLLAGAALGTLTGIGTGIADNLEHRLATGVHWLGEEMGHLAHNAGAIGAQERGIDARPAPMALDWERAVGPHQMAQPLLSPPPSSYEHARVSAANSALSSATTVSIPSASTFLPSRQSIGRPMHDIPLPNFPGGMNGPRPLTQVQRAALHRDHAATSSLRSTRPPGAAPGAPPHPHGLGRH